MTHLQLDKSERIGSVTECGVESLAVMLFARVKVTADPVGGCTSTSLMIQ
jgi:hypothetical protein